MTYRLTAKQALEIQKKQTETRPKNSTEKELDSVLRKIEIHANDGYTGMYIHAYKLNDETINTLKELGYIITLAKETDDENFECDAYHICWDDEDFDDVFSLENIKKAFVNKKV